MNDDFEDNDVFIRFLNNQYGCEQNWRTEDTDRINLAYEAFLFGKETERDAGG